MSKVSGNAKRVPLDLLQKWKVSQYWACQQPPLTRASLSVLLRLLERQNPKNGRCDPSAVRLGNETGFSERTIRSAFKELEERGAVKRYRKAQRSRNQFLIFSVAELSQHAPMKGSGPHGQLRDVKLASANPATYDRVNLQQPAPQTIKETIKKSAGAERKLGNGAMLCPIRGSNELADLGLGEFERRVAKVFEREGYGYEGLMALPVGTVESIYIKLQAGKLTFGRAVGELLHTYRAL
jgi:DNA-binding Lrp family transcriptional regulator